MRSRDAVLLADEAGVGKSAQAIRATYDLHPTLIVSPNSLKYWWADEIHRWLDSDTKVAVYTKADRYNANFWKRDVHYTIVHWEALRLHVDAIRRRRWACVIADEAQRMKNRRTKQSKAVRSIRPSKRYALTGSPIINRPSELWPVLNFLWPKRYTSFWRFFHEHVLALQNPWGGWEELGIRDKEKLRDELRPFTMRRLKEKVLPDLPPKVYTKIPVELLPEQRKAYEQMKKEMIATLPDGQVVITPTVLAQLTRLRQIACGLHLVGGPEISSKLDAAEEIVLDRGGEPTVAFSQFLGIVHGLQVRLARDGLNVQVIVGDVPEETRQGIVEMFQNGLLDAVICTTQVGGVGHTLTRADTALFLDKSWSPAIQSQAEDRIHRIGQRASAQIITLEAIDTVEQRIERLLHFKERLVGQVFPRGEFEELL